MTLPGTDAARPVALATSTIALAWPVALIALCVVLLGPLLVVDVPPLLDYPNHLARAFVLASLPDDTVLARFYAPHWSIIPNLALDLITPPLMHVLPVYVAGRLLIAVALLLPVLGTIAYNTALGGRCQGRWWSLGVGLIAYNNCLLYGFLNFEISLGLALLLAAAWLRWREDYPWRTIALALTGALILFTCHLMGLIFFGLLIGGAELFRLFEPSRRGVGREIVTRGAVLLLVFAAPFALYAVSALQQLGGDAGFLPFGAKLLQLVSTFVNYRQPLDAMTAAVVTAVPVVSILMRWGRVPGPATCAIVLLMITFLAAPFAWKGTYALDTRFAVMLGFMLFAGFIPEAWPRALRFSVALWLVVLFAARMAVLTSAWAEHRTDLADLRQVMQPIQPGQAVYVANVGVAQAPAYWRANPRFRLLGDGARTDEHLGALVLIERRAFWPFEFDNPSQQPIETRAAYRTLADRVRDMPTSDIAAVADVCGFDYVLLLEADAVPDLPADRFRLLTRSGFAALYAITRCKPSS